MNNYRTAFMSAFAIIQYTQLYNVDTVQYYKLAIKYIALFGIVL